MSLTTATKSNTLSTLDGFVQLLQSLDQAEDFKPLFDEFSHPAKRESLTQTAMDDAIIAFADITRGLPRKNIPGPLVQKMFSVRDNAEYSADAALEKLKEVRAELDRGTRIANPGKPTFLDVINHPAVPVPLYANYATIFRSLVSQFGDLGASETALRARNNARGVANAIAEGANQEISKRQAASDKSHQAGFDGVTLYGPVDQSPSEMLDALVGEEEAKSAFHDIGAVVAFEVAKKKAGLTKDTPADLLANFTLAGPRGVGKSTVAQAIATLYKNTGLLPGNGGHVVEVSETANFGSSKERDLAIIDQAEGGVLVLNNPSVFLEANGREVANMLMKQMDLRKGRMAFALAGSQHTIDMVFKTFPQLEEGFSRRLSFRELSPEEMVEATRKMLASPERGGLEVEEQAVPLLKAMFRFEKAMKESSFQNAYEAAKMATLLETKHAAGLRDSGILSQFLSASRAGEAEPAGGTQALKTITLDTVRAAAREVDAGQYKSFSLGFMSRPNRTVESFLDGAPERMHAPLPPKAPLSPRP